MPPSEQKFATYGINGDGVQHFADKLYDESISGIKESYKKHNIDLITKDDFTEEQIKTLSSFEGSDWLKGVVSETRYTQHSNDYVSWSKKQTWDIGRSAYNYKHYKTFVALPKDFTMFGLMAKALGVDAIMIVNHKFDLAKGAGYSQFSMNMVGINPISYEKATEGKKGMALKLINKNYFEGVPYIYSTFDFSKPVVIANREKKDYVNENYSGFNSFMKNSVNITLKYFDKRTE